MEGISDIRIIGFDEQRPPRIRKEPYIDLFFQLSHKVPDEWCRDFVSSLPKLSYDVKMNPDDAVFIQTWVRTAEEIPGHLEVIKTLVSECNARYIENIQASARARQTNKHNKEDDDGPQGRLNRIVAGLDFGS